MKVKRKAFLAAAFTVLLCLGFAVSSVAEAGSFLYYSPRARGSWLTIGAGTERFHYEEYPIMELQGSLTSLKASTYFPFAGNFFGGLAGSASFGDTIYDGRTWGGDPLRAPSEDTIYRFGGYTGATYPLETARLQPYGGIYFRYWQNEVLAAGGYPREIFQGFWFGGASLEFDLNPNLTIAVGADGSELIYGSVKSHFSQPIPGANDPVVEQTEGYGMRAYGASRLEFSGITLNLQVYGRYSFLADSQSGILYVNGSQIEVYEPANSTTILGINVGVSFSLS